MLRRKTSRPENEEEKVLEDRRKQLKIEGLKFYNKGFNTKAKVNYR
jgi:hypothetical protein